MSGESEDNPSAKRWAERGDEWSETGGPAAGGAGEGSVNGARDAARDYFIPARLFPELRVWFGIALVSTIIAVGMVFPFFIAVGIKCNKLTFRTSDI